MNRPDVPKSAVPIDLASEADFPLGPITVSPPLREIRVDARRETIEPRVMQALVALAQAKGAVVSRDALIELCWGGRIVGDDAINRCIAKVRAVAEISAAPSFEIETVPRVGYRLEVLSHQVADPDVAPESSQSQPNIDPLAWLTSRRIGAGALVIMALLGVAAYWEGWSRKATTTTPATIAAAARSAFGPVAVLPFSAIGGSGTDAQAIAAPAVEQMIALLNNNQIRTISEADSRAIRGSFRDQNAARLGLAFQVDGTVQRIGAVTRITAHIDHLSTHSTIWTGFFEQQSGDPAPLETRVATAVADKLKVVRDANKPNVGAISDEALTAYLKASDYGRLPIDKTSLEQVLDLLRVVLASAPSFKPVYSDIALTSALLIPFNPPADAAKLRIEASKWATQSLALDPKNGDAYWALALLVPHTHWSDREQLYRRGLAAAPDHDTLNAFFGDFLSETGRMNESVSYQRRSLALDPLSPSKTMGLAWSLAQTGQCAEAMQLISRAYTAWPSFPQIWDGRLKIPANCGHLSEARAVLDAPENAPMPPEADFITAWRSYIDALQTKIPSANKLAVQAILQARHSGQIGETGSIIMLAGLGETDAAFAQANASMIPRTGRGLGEPKFDTAVLFGTSAKEMRSDVRFMPLVQRIGLAEYWTKSGKWPDFCSLPQCQHAVYTAAVAATSSHSKQEIAN